MRSWDEVQALGEPDGWAEVSENGWGALLAWAAGPENTRRHPTTDDGRTIRTIVERPGQPPEFSTEPFTEVDRDLIEEGVNTYLEDAGVPPRPPGYTWYIRVWPPSLTAAEFLDQVNADVNTGPTGTVMPAQWRERMETVLAEMYQL